MVGSDTSNVGVRSQTQASPPAWDAISESSRSRIGSDNALNTAARDAAWGAVSGSRTSGPASQSSTAGSGRRSRATTMSTSSEFESQRIRRESNSTQI